ncbi:hypothetical protein [Bordetella sp. 2513F-2]
MPIHGEPRNGDFASYVEALSQQGRTAPGQVARPTRDAAAQVLSPSNWGRSRGEKTADNAGQAPTDPWQGSFSEADAPPLPLAARNSQRRIAAGLTIAALVAAWFALTQLMQALRQPVEPEAFIPVAFLGVCAFMLYNGGRRLRARVRRAPAPRYGKLQVGKKDAAQQQT